jgi:FkbM family methyltransferase
MMLKKRRVLHVDILELGLIFLLLVGFGIWIWTPTPQASHVQSENELAYFAQRYGPSHYTEREEEWLIRDFFQDRRGGVFVDVGANHYRDSNKTYYLEKHLDWSGLAVEPQREFEQGYKEHRPRTIFRPFFVSDSSNATAKLYMSKRSTLIASSDRKFLEQFGSVDEVRDVPTITLTDLLNAEGIERVDFLSIDIELHEPQALRGFDLKRFTPALVCIEGLLPVRQQIIDYFAARGYTLVGKYMWVDRENLYFAPLQAAKG